MQKYIHNYTDAAPLAVFRIFFGSIMLFSMLRFQYYGWIEKLYIEPQFFFSYLGLEWIKPLGEYTYGLFFICGVAALLVALGLFYRVAIIIFFLSFTYIELMDKTTYLNHYYFVSCLSFLMIFLPAHARFSVDALRQRYRLAKYSAIPIWTIDAIKLTLSIVWFYAGLAKLNSDWLLEAQPLKIWLTAKYDIPFLGDLLQQEVFHYLFSWGGAAYDLSIPFLLWYRKTRYFGFALVVIFHLLTWILFPIGVFPWVMIGSAIIFLFPTNPIKVKPPEEGVNSIQSTHNLPWKRYFLLNNYWRRGAVVVFLLLQLLIPFRHLLYDGELFWTEEGFRFSWRVMLMEKAGYANFKIKDPATGKQFYVQNGNFLTPLQEKQMATQPDMILEFAHYLDKHYRELGIKSPAIFVESYVALNGRSSQPYIDPSIDLSAIKPSWKPKTFILPFNDEIKGF